MEGDGRKKGRAETVGERFPPVFIKCQTFLKQDLWLVFDFKIILGDRPKVDPANLRHMTALDYILLLIYHDQLRVPENQRIHYQRRSAGPFVHIGPV